MKLLLSLFALQWIKSICCSNISPQLIIDPFLNESSLNQSIILEGSKLSVFSGAAPLPIKEGLDGELVTFSPFDGCRALQESNSTIRDESGVKFKSMSANKKVIVLIHRGNCSFEDKFRNAQKIANVAGALIINNSDSMQNKIELTAEDFRIPGMMISDLDGEKIVSLMKATNSSTSQGQKQIWTKVTMLVKTESAAFLTVMQFTLIIVIVLLAVSFIASILMHMKIYRQQRRIARRGSAARNRLLHGHSFGDILPKSELEKIAIFPYSSSTKMINETCPICLDEFKIDDQIRKLKCEHVFHAICIDPWLLEKSAKCPMCKYDLLEKKRSETTELFTLPPMWHYSGHSVMDAIILEEHSSARLQSGEDIETGGHQNELRRIHSESSIPSRASSSEAFNSSSDVNSEAARMFLSNLTRK